MKEVAPMHGMAAPSEWIVRWSHLLPSDATVLDVACGAGRHMQWFAGRGHAVTGVDRSPEAVEAAGAFGHAVEADIESGSWPFTGQAFGAVIVTNYLWRPRMADIVAAVAPGGVLLYETFAAGNETIGKPSRPDFLLQPGELLAACAGLRVVAYEDGFVPEPARFVQRIAAVRPTAPDAGPPARHLLKGN
ncbi:MULTISPECIES: class I SAM-dependent methyltransferase [unclassified Variovorax]|mgnify:CR=1 FL=1|jgi:SAM-dependent methyltransferase|uniref:class I SAM-dependent methyltransferase n=1 Tax=unclassified Variovorax TaxID=663243 RepID=UPI000F7F5E5E|nr:MULTISPECIES: class I SAM-dependent methyltransferase [unclassified Variovorax]RSZ33755.1 class I SAM-dependent methyltransferase [Variovorax sp. 553]RSZ34249.1 class I SAM-dependent methyltransferase [Variovorax sp. 679]